uniref:MACPF domain-containing protein n=1 Tax=Biomphalaria glabrata TaxID=6526 RepID=A0A2C9M066_BIOGL
MRCSRHRMICKYVTLVVLSIVQVKKTDASRQCSNLPPGIQKMVMGVDITRLDLVPLDVVGSYGFVGPILQFTCDENNTWKSPEGIVYELPDQIWHMSSRPGGWLSASVNLYKSYEDVRSAMATEVGGEGVIWKFAFSASKTYKKMQNAITNSSRYISDVGAFESATRADFVPNWVLTLDKYAQNFIDKYFNETFETDPKSYDLFISLFGTHYFSKANFGGYIRLVLETTTDYFYSRSDNEVQTYARATLFNIISAHGGKVSSSLNIDEHFTNSSTQTVRYYGGNTNLLTQNGIEEWQNTVDNDPWLFSGELKPISSLITDERKKSSLDKAVENYVLQTYLSEMERLVTSAMAKFKDPILNNLLTQIIQLKTLKVLTYGDVDTLSNDIQSQLMAPVWFTTKTRLCLKWSAQAEDGQCGGGADNVLCATPNSLTPLYQDNTDNRRGGCFMQWGLLSSDFPSWFQAVQVCYQWSGSDSCGGGAANLLCAGINDFSPVYLDDSDDSPGGCAMSWKLEVPATAPVWMKSAKICLVWYPDYDAGQCGHASSRDLCAVANQWTENYYDHTDERRGGCRMRWGIKLEF